MDSSPVVFLTGQVNSKLIGYDAFQETDVTGITLPITKHNYLVTDVHELGHVLREAFYIARSGRPGEVVRRFFAVTDATRFGTAPPNPAD